MVERILELFDTYGYLIILLANFIDSLPFGGLIIPEEVVMAIVGFSANQGHSSILLLILFGTIGTLAGQIIVYFVSHKYGERLLQWMQVTKKRRGKLKKYIESQNVLGILIRTSSTFRAILGILSGMNRVDFKRFFMIELIISSAKSAVFVLLGYYFGRGSAELEILLTRLSLLLLISSGISFGIWLYLSKAVFRDE